MILNKSFSSLLFYIFSFSIIALLDLFIFTACGNGAIIKYSSEDDMYSQEYEAVSYNITTDENDNIDNNIYVHITGAVFNPGVVCLPAGSRLFEAVEMAGGFCDNASRDYCNLALVVNDGDKYLILTEEEAKLEVAKLQEASLISSAAISHYDSDGKLNINIASLEELMQLPGIGKTRANAIIEYRDNSGLFMDIADLKNVSGIKDALFNQVSEFICTN